MVRLKQAIDLRVEIRGNLRKIETASSRERMVEKV